jgi:hypothetical protein
MIQELFWKEFYHLKFQVNYIEQHLGKTELIDRSIKMFLAITSTGSIGAWVIWKNYALVWGFLIASSQVLNTIKSYLPYKDRLKSFSGLLTELDGISLYAELKWIDISSGLLTDDDVRKCLADIKTKKHVAVNKYVGNSIIPENSNFIDKANQVTSDYFESLYITSLEVTNE